MTRSLLVACGVATLVASSGCVHHGHGGHGQRAHAEAVVVHKPGPPPHAPAHGHRHRHHQQPDIDLVFDSGLGVYVVVGREDLFFYREHFYRVMDDVWHRSLRIDSGWVLAHKATVPTALAKKHRKARKHHKQGHRHPAKFGRPR